MVYIPYGRFHTRDSDKFGFDWLIYETTILGYFASRTSGNPKRRRKERKAERRGGREGNEEEERGRRRWKRRKEKKRVKRKEE